MSELKKPWSVSFILSHNYNIRGKSLGLNEQNHYRYELTIKKSENKYILHYFKQNGSRIVVVEQNSEMTVSDCEKLMSLGKIFEKNGYEFECDGLLAKKGSTSIVKRKSTLIETVGDEKVRKTKSEKEKLLDKRERLVLSLSKVDEELKKYE